MTRTEEPPCALSDASPDMYFVADLETGVIAECNQQLRETAGEFASGTSLLELCHAQSVGTMKLALHALRTEPGIRNVELSLKRVGGSAFAVMLSASTLPASDTERALVQGWFRDIAHLKRFSNVEVLIADFPSCILLADEKGRISATNTAANQMLGYRKGGTHRHAGHWSADRLRLHAAGQNRC